MKEGNIVLYNEHEEHSIDVKVRDEYEELKCYEDGFYHSKCVGCLNFKSCLSRFLDN